MSSSNKRHHNFDRESNSNKKTKSYNTQLQQSSSSSDPIDQFYQSLIDCRRSVASLNLSNCISTLHGLLRKLLQYANQLNRLKMDLTQFLDALRKLQAGCEREGVSKNNLLRLTALLDECYYTLYYCLDVHARSQHSQSRNPLAPPHIYFSSTIYDTDSLALLNKQLSEYLENSVTATGRAQLAELWGPLLQGGGSSSSTVELGRKNPLLLLHFARWRESVCLLDLLGAIPDSTDSAVLLQSLRPQVLDKPSDATMKGTDPLLPDRLRQWADACRVWPCHLYAFATPTAAAIDRIAALAPIVEIGAGTGYWSHLLRTMHKNISVVAYDKDPPVLQGKVIKPNDYHGKSRAWTTVLRGGPEVAAQHSSHSLLLCYPPPDNAMALLALRAYKGNTVCYVGEWQGDTGTRAFEKLLSAEFRCEERMSLPNWTDTCYSLTVWQRRSSTAAAGGEATAGKEKKARIPATASAGSSTVKGAGSAAVQEHLLPHRVHPFQCAQCGCGRVEEHSTSSSISSTSSSGVRQLHRCRMSYDLSFCSSHCAALGRALHLDELAVRCLLQGRQDGEQGQVCSDSSAPAPLIELSAKYFIKVPAPVIDK